MLKQDVRTLKDVFKQALIFRKSIAVFLFGSFAASFTEMAFLGALYVLFSVDKKAYILNLFGKYAIFNTAQLFFIEKNFIFIAIALSVFILLIRLLSAIFSRFALAYIQTKVTIKLSNKLLSCFLDTHPMVWSSWRKEKIINIITNEAAASGEFIYIAMNMLMSAIIMLSLVTGAFIISAKLTIFCIIAGISVLALNYFNYAKARRLGEIKVKSKSMLLGRVYDVISGHKILKLESAEAITKAKMSSVINHSNLWLLKKAKNINLVMSLSEILIYFLFFGLVIISQIFNIFDQAAILTLLVFAIRLQSAMTDFQAQWMRYQELSPNFIDVREMLNFANRYAFGKERVAPYLTASQREGYAVRLEHVHFSYGDGEPDILKDINLVCLPADRILITGASGSGKSTIINILCGVLKPKKGRIFFNNEELTTESFYNFRNYISYSSPDAYIFKGTLKDNISLGLDASDEEILSAIKKAGLEEFVNSLDRGIYSTIADNASSISLGERQRLVLARMFLKNPRLVLLDEATANLDLELENTIFNNLLKNLPRTTIITVTHRAPKNFIFDSKFELRDGALLKQ